MDSNTTCKYDLYEIHAKQAADLGPEWKACGWRLLKDALHMEITLGIPHVLQSGKRRGQPTFKGVPQRKVMFTSIEHARWKTAWLAEHNMCEKCEGEGRIFLRYTIVEGSVYAPCEACAGTGLRAAGAAAP